MREFPQSEKEKKYGGEGVSEEKETSRQRRTDDEKKRNDDGEGREVGI